MSAYFEKPGRDFLAVATPGAGKTTFALTVAADLLRRRHIERVTSVAPTEHLKRQWAEAPSRAGVEIDPSYSPARGKASRDYVGVAVTYAGDASAALAFRVRTQRFKTLVIHDEVHHAGDALSWGEAVREAFQPATRRLALTGTPFRSDVNPIPFVEYAPGPDGVARSVADYAYGYAEALADSRAAGPVHGVLRRRAVAVADGRGSCRPARRASDARARSASAADSPRRRGRMDGSRARCRRPTAVGGPTTCARRRRSGDRRGPRRRPGIRRIAATPQRRAPDRRLVRRPVGEPQDRHVLLVRRSSSRTWSASSRPGMPRKSISSSLPTATAPSGPNHRQSERIRQQTRSSGRAAPEPQTAHQRLAALRKELNGLIAAWHHRSGDPHGVIHAELRRVCGGPLAATASADELAQRIDTIRD